MGSLEVSPHDQGPVKIQNLGDFDMQYFQEMEGQNGWLALGQENCVNQRYFTVYGSKGEKLGIVGVYDTADEKNVTHTVVDQKYRGQGLAAKFKQRLIDELNLPFITLTISLDNIASIRATEKLPGVRKVSDAEYERDFHKVKYVYERPEEKQIESAVSPAPETVSEQRIEEGREAEKRIAEIRDQLKLDEEERPTKTIAASPVSASEGKMQISFDVDAVKGFLIEQGLSEEQAADLKIEFGKLRWSNEATRFFASFLPDRFREIFTRVESLKGNTLKVFTNNLDAIYDKDSGDIVARDTIHHLVHFAQRKKGVGGFKHFLTRLPIIHGLSKYEKEARNIAREADLENGPWVNLVQFSSQREDGNNNLKIKI